MRAPAALLAALIVVSVGSARGAPGDLDPAFGTNGKVVTAFGAGIWGWPYDVAVQRDGKVVAAGASGRVGHEHFTLVRYRRDGKLDPTFGARGRVTSPLARFDEVLELALQPDGKIVAVGTGADESRDYGIVARYGPRGALDPTFGSGGKVLAQPAERSFLGGGALQPDGKIVVAGAVGTSSRADLDFVVGRYNADGSPDESFGSQGWTSTSFGDDDSVASSVVLQPDGKILAAGVRAKLVEPGIYESRGFVLARYLSDGRVDPAFGEDGRVTSRIGDGGQAISLALQPNGKIVAGGSTIGRSGENVDATADLALIRYMPDGRLDQSFGHGGQVITKSVDFAAAADIVLLRGGRIAVAVGAGRVFEVARYLSNGELDPSFGVGGIAKTKFLQKLESAFAVTVQPDGKLIAVGTTYDSAKRAQDFAVARFLDRQAVCRVPKLKGRRLLDAGHAVRRSHCSVGGVTRVFSSRIGRGRVISQHPKPGARLVAGGKVALVVSKGARHA
jgi:uncharacterized delta-60 repeat protein